MIRKTSAIELWGGVECTVNRVGDSYIDQLDRAGHTQRLSDFDLFKNLGIKALRQPVLWERAAQLGDAAWDWPDAAMGWFRANDIRPIVGLVHHGSGPRQTNLLDQDFPDKLAGYARTVAERYPWVIDYTPINEPLTTARFSGLYGHWYPHHRDDFSFARALVIQCRAVALAMRSIRKVNPDARLIQTEDLGTVFGTPHLKYQCDFENERRWCTYDLLCGWVSRDHPMWNYLSWVGIPSDKLEWFLDNPCVPSVIGVNHYLSSDRFLDERVDLYPEYTRGGNGRDEYADVLARRVRRSHSDSLGALLGEASQRYGLPVAITECHNGCTREEQLRWFSDVWHTASTAREQGTDIVAVTAWSLLGAFDWDHLVTQNNGHYESGVFDIRSMPPRPTAMAKMISCLSTTRQFDHPVLQVPGWWKRPNRFIHGISVDESGDVRAESSNEDPSLHAGELGPVLITGSNGALGQAFSILCKTRGIPFCAVSKSELDIANPLQVRRAFFEYRPWAVINCAEYANIDKAENDFQRCQRENTEGPVLLAEACAQHNVQLLTFSTDQVFDGRKSSPYTEDDDVSPLNCYGISKALAEKHVLELLPTALVVRLGVLFGPWNEDNFVSRALRDCAAERNFNAADDSIFSASYLPDVANACLDLLIDGEGGIWHMTNPGETSWAEVAETVAWMSGVSPRSLKRCRTADLGLRAERALHSVLESSRGILLPPLADAVSRYVMAAKSKPEVGKVAA